MEGASTKHGNVIMTMIAATAVTKARTARITTALVRTWNSLAAMPNVSPRTIAVMVKMTAAKVQTKLVVVSFKIQLFFFS